MKQEGKAGVFLIRNRNCVNCIKGILLLFLLVLLPAEFLSAEEETEAPPELHAQCAVLMDGYTGRILFEKEGDRQVPMASTTKIMTCILTLEYADMEDSVTVSPYAASMPDVQLGICAGEQFQLENLLLSLMLESHNDSAVAIAEYVGEQILKQQINGSEEKNQDIMSIPDNRTADESKYLVSVFADAMNQKALELGCSHTWFITPNGLDASEQVVTESGIKENRQHSTTAADLAEIMRYCTAESEKKDLFLQITNTEQADFSDIQKKREFHCENHNRYLTMNKNALSGKTGFTGKAGYCYVGAVNQNGCFLIVALLGCGWPPAKNLKWEDMNQLITYGTEKYRSIVLPEPEKANFSFIAEEDKKNGNKMVRKKYLVSLEPSVQKALIGKDEKLDTKWYFFSSPGQQGDAVGSYDFYIQNQKVFHYVYRIKNIYSLE